MKGDSRQLDSLFVFLEAFAAAFAFRTGFEFLQSDERWADGVRGVVGFAVHTVETVERVDPTVLVDGLRFADVGAD